MLKEKEEQQAYIDAINEMVNKPESQNEPQVEVGKDREVPFRKPNNEGGVIGEAQRQTQADVDNFIANRNYGDQEMLDYAMENGDNIYFGGPGSAQTPLNGRDRFFRNNIEDSYAPTGDVMQLPGAITRNQIPSYIQQHRDSNARKYDEMMRDEAFRYLRQMAGIGL